MDKRLTLNMKEITRLYIIQQIEDKKMTGLQATEMLDYQYGR